MASVRHKERKALILQRKCVIKHVPEFFSGASFCRGHVNMGTHTSGKSHNFKSKQVGTVNVLFVFYQSPNFVAVVGIGGDIFGFCLICFRLFFFCSLLAFSSW